MKVIGASAFEKKLRDFPGLLGRDVESVLKQGARATCVFLGNATDPTGMQDGHAEANRNKVERQVRQVFLAKEPPWQLLAALKRRSPRLFHGYIRARQEGDEKQMRRYLQEAGIQIGVLNPSTHRAARTTASGGVPKDYQGSDMVTSPQLAAYAKRKRAQVGLAKAGWYAAAKSLGGRVRSNDTVNGKRVTAEIFPPYLRKLARKYPGTGGSRIQPGRVEVFSNVRHAREAIRDGNLDDALFNARQSFHAALYRQLQIRRKSIFKVA